MSKIEDFGVHANAYYPLEISHFKSSQDAKLLDLLWNKYWVTTLSQSPLISVSAGLGHHPGSSSIAKLISALMQNRGYMTSQLGDLVAKLGKTDQAVQHRCNIGALSPIIAAAKAARGKAKADNNEKGSSNDRDAAKEELPLAKAVKDRYVARPAPVGVQSPAFELISCHPVDLRSTQLSLEASHGLIGALLKDSLFNGGRLAQEGGNSDDFKLPPVVS